MASVILLLMMALAYFPQYESTDLKHEMEKRQANPQDVPAKELYKFRYENDDNTYREEVGKLLNPGTENEKLFVDGEYGFKVNGNTFVVKYTAGDNGYVPIHRFTPIRPISSTGLPNKYLNGGISLALLRSLAEA